MMSRFQLQRFQLASVLQRTERHGIIVCASCPQIMDSFFRVSGSNTGFVHGSPVAQPRLRALTAHVYRADERLRRSCVVVSSACRGASAISTRHPSLVYITRRCIEVFQDYRFKRHRKVVTHHFPLGLGWHGSGRIWGVSTSATDARDSGASMASMVH